MSLGPKPFGNRSIPIWMGGNADAVLRRTGRFADGYICSTSAMPNFPATSEKDQRKGDANLFLDLLTVLA